MIHRIGGAVLLVLVGVLLAYKLRMPPVDAPSAAGPTTAGIQTLEPLDLQKVRLQITEGDHKVTLVNLWATWCVPCRKEFPELLALRDKFGPQGLKLVLISADSELKKAEAQEFLNEQKVDFTSFYKGNQGFEAVDQIYPQWNGALPTSVILDKSGKVLEAWFGETTGPEFEEKLKRHL